MSSNPANHKQDPPLRLPSPAALFSSVLEDRSSPTSLRFAPNTSASPQIKKPPATAGVQQLGARPDLPRPALYSPHFTNRTEPKEVRHSPIGDRRPQPNYPQAFNSSTTSSHQHPRPPAPGSQLLSLLGLLAEEDGHRLGNRPDPHPVQQGPGRIQPRNVVLKRTSADAVASAGRSRYGEDVSRANRGLAMSKSLGDLSSLPALAQEKWQREVVLSSSRRAIGGGSRAQLIGTNRDRQLYSARTNAASGAAHTSMPVVITTSTISNTHDDADDPLSTPRSRARSRRVEESVPLFLVNLRHQLQARENSHASSDASSDGDSRESGSSSSNDTTPHESSTDTENDFALTASERDSGDEEADLSEWADDGTLTSDAQETAECGQGESDPVESRRGESVSWTYSTPRRSPSSGARDPRKLVTVTLDHNAAKRGSRREGHQILVPRDEEFTTVGWNYGQLSRRVVEEEGALLQSGRDFLSIKRLEALVSEEDKEDDNENDNENESNDLDEEADLEPVSPCAPETATERSEEGEKATPQMTMVETKEARTEESTPPTKTRIKPTQRKRTKKKKKKLVQLRQQQWIYLDVLLIEATDLLVQKNALQTIYGVKNLGNPYIKVSLMSDGVPWHQNGDAGGGHPYRTRSMKGPLDHPMWNDGISYVYKRLSVEKLWERIQPPNSNITQPELREEAKERFLQRWKKLEEGPNSMAEQHFYDRWRVRCEPQLEIKLYFTGGKKDILAGSVSVPLADLQDTYLHDLWLNLHPCTKLPEPRNESEQQFLDKWVRSEVWGSVHLLIQKSKRERNGMLRTYGIAVRPFPLRMEVGDIILFDSSSLRTQGTKIATRSRWDHAALVVQERGESELQLFEATMDGVLVFNLKRRLKAYIRDTNIAVRRLEVERTDEMMEALHQFIETVKGRPYKKNPVELLKALAKVNATDNLGSIFCSQLVAAAYQVMGLLSMDEPSNNYLPGDLASNSRVKLLKGTLGELMLIPRLKPTKKGKRTSV